MSCLDRFIQKYRNNIFGRKNKKNQDKMYYKI